MFCALRWPGERWQGSAMKTLISLMAVAGMAVPSSDFSRQLHSMAAAVTDGPTSSDELIDNISVVAPLLIVGIVLIIAFSIYSAVSDKTVQGAKRTECKGEIMIAMRKQVTGLSLSELAKLLRLSEAQTLEILEEMKKDNQVYTTEHRGREVWCLRGIGEGFLYTK